MFQDLVGNELRTEEEFFRLTSRNEFDRVLPFGMQLFAMPHGSQPMVSEGFATNDVSLRPLARWYYRDVADQIVYRVVGDECLDCARACLAPADMK